jgi:hypothetical protein
MNMPACVLAIKVACYKVAFCLKRAWVSYVHPLSHQFKIARSHEKERSPLRYPYGHALPVHEDDGRNEAIVPTIP